ncbi:hypothetical protein [Streptomyces fragilis]|uniref:Uncharacterized protein n=1 Tax=Streptomyces fragilis TaxID=67301 RepID=A0ABV2YH95_9ACTN|nr:hypothetical protein [Streptomyces fragilis]
MLPFTMLAFLAGIGATGGVILAFPSLLGHYGTMTELSNFVALIPSIALVACLERRMPAVERSAVRRLDTRDVLLVSGFALLATAAAAAMSLLESPTTLVAARNNLLFCGLSLGAWPLLGHRAPLLPVFWTIQAMFVGGRSRNDPYPWVMVTEAAHVTHATAGSLIVFLAGVLSLVCCTPRTAR